MEERIEQTYETGADAEVSVSNLRGPISVEGWDEPRVHLIAVRHDERAQVLVEHDGARLEIRTEVEMKEWGLKSFFGREGTGVVAYQLRVPRGAQVRARNVSGPVHVSNLTNGVEAASVDGVVNVVNVSGRVKVQATNGAVQLNGVVGQAEAQTTNGAVTVRDSELETITAEAVNGAISIAPVRGGAQVAARTVNGELRLELASDVRADVDASGVMLKTDFQTPHEAARSGRGAWRGVVGHGPAAARVSFKTVNGRLHVTGGGAAPAAAGAWQAQPEAAGAEQPPAASSTPSAARVGATASPYPNVMSILAAVERGELTVDQATDLMKTLNQA